MLLFFLGVSAGLFNVPLEAYLQHRSPRQIAAAILAASNFLTFSGICLASFLFAALRMPRATAAGEKPTQLFSPQQIFLLAGLFTMPVFFYIVFLIPQASIRFFVWLLSLTVYRVRVFGRENLPREGGALLVPNHVTWVDGILLMLTSSRPIRMIAWAPNIERRPWIKRLAEPVRRDSDRPAQAQEDRRRAPRRPARRCNDGELVCIFPEGGLTRTGQVQAFKPGMMKILEGTDRPGHSGLSGRAVGQHLQLQRRASSSGNGPSGCPYPMSIHFGPPIDRARRRLTRSARPCWSSAPRPRNKARKP